MRSFKKLRSLRPPSFQIQSKLSLFAIVSKFDCLYNSDESGSKSAYLDWPSAHQMLELARPAGTFSAPFVSTTRTVLTKVSTVKETAMKAKLVFLVVSGLSTLLVALT